MGCGISRYDSTHVDHDLDRRSTDEFCIGDDDHQCNVSPVVIHVNHMTPAALRHDHHAGPQVRLTTIYTQPGSQMEFPATQKSSTAEEIRRNLENSCSHDHKHDNIEIRKSNAKCLWDDDDIVNDGRISNCNLEDINGTGGGGSPLFMGSPSFREYCVDVGCRSSSSDDHLNSDINNYNIGNKEREEKMWRKDNIRDSNQGSTRSNVAGAVKKTRTRRFKKASSSVHKPGAVRSLMNVATCYHPHPHRPPSFSSS